MLLALNTVTWPDLNMFGYILSILAPYTVVLLYHKLNPKQPAIDVILALDSDLWESTFDDGKLWDHYQIAGVFCLFVCFDS